MSAQFTLTHRVQFPETDMAGVVHFSNYFRWMEEVEHAFFRSRGLSVVMNYEGQEIGWPRVAANCEFFGPARFEDEIILHLRVTKVGEKSFNYDVEFVCNGKRIALGRIASVCCQMTSAGMRAIPIPPAIRDKLAAPAR